MPFPKLVEKQGVPPWSVACEATALVLSYIPNHLPALLFLWFIRPASTAHAISVHVTHVATVQLERQ